MLLQVDVLFLQIMCVDNVFLVATQPHDWVTSCKYPPVRSFSVWTVCAVPHSMLFFCQHQNLCESTSVYKTIFGEINRALLFAYNMYV